MLTVRRDDLIAVGVNAALVTIIQSTANPRPPGVPGGKLAKSPPKSEAAPGIAQNAVG